MGGTRGAYLDESCYSRGQGVDYRPSAYTAPEVTPGKNIPRFLLGNWTVKLALSVALLPGLIHPDRYNLAPCDW